jgi:hypothetical protein
MAMEAKLIVIQPSNSPPLSQKRAEDGVIDPLFPIVSWMAIMTAIAISTYAFISKERQKSRLRTTTKTICHSCEYFTENLYLNCALHPTTVLTAASVDCVDYCPNSKTKRTEQLKRSMPFVSKIFPD